MFTNQLLLNTDRYLPRPTIRLFDVNITRFPKQPTTNLAPVDPKIKPWAADTTFSRRRVKMKPLSSIKICSVNFNPKSVYRKFLKREIFEECYLTLMSYHLTHWTTDMIYNLHHCIENEISINLKNQTKSVFVSRPVH